MNEDQQQAWWYFRTLCFEGPDEFVDYALRMKGLVYAKTEKYTSLFG